jgi:hypothetical protein
VRAVSDMPTTRQTSHAGKSDPRISNEGARVQPVSGHRARAIPKLKQRPGYLLIMIPSFLKSVEFNYPSGTQVAPVKKGPFRWRLN